VLITVALVHVLSGSKDCQSTLADSSGTGKQNASYPTSYSLMQVQEGCFNPAKDISVATINEIGKPGAQPHTQAPPTSLGKRLPYMHAGEVNECYMQASPISQQLR